MDTNNTSVLFMGSGAVAGGSISATYGSVGLVGGFGGMSIGAAPLVTAGAIAGGALSGTIAAIQDRDATAIAALGAGTLGGIATYGAVGGVGVGIGGTAFDIGMSTMAGMGGIVGLGVYGIAKMVLRSHNATKSYANAQAIADITAEYELGQKFVGLEVEKELAKLKAHKDKQKKPLPKVSSYFLWGKNQNWHQSPKPQARTPVATKQPSLEVKLQLKQTIPARNKAIASLVLSPDGETLAQSTNNGQVRLYHPHTGRNFYTFFAGSHGIDALAITPDGTKLIAGDAKGNIAIWELKTKNLLQSFSAHQGLVSCIVCDGVNLITASSDKTIKVWELKTARLKRTLTEHQDTIFSLTLAKDGKTLASGSADKTIRVGKLDSYQYPILLLLDSWATSLVFTAHDKLLISGDTIGCLQFWHWPTHTLLKAIATDTAPISALAISPKENLLASATANNSVKLWHLPKGEFLREFTGGSPLTFSNDGQTLVTCSKEDGVSIWQLGLSRAD
jgi:hypothetical protein